ncbi:hypothetical protein FKM82_023002, partial [Ascaphus truei]
MPTFRLRTMRKLGHFILFVLHLWSGGVFGDSVEPKESKMFIEEGMNFTFSCSSSTSYATTFYLYWYRHYPNRGPEYILHKANKGTASESPTFTKGRFISEVNSDSTNLTIVDLKMVDSATYHCALQRAQ